MNSAPRTTNPGKLLFLAFLALCCIVPEGRAQDPARLQAAPVLQAAPHPLSQVAFIGASVSAGFGNARELKVGSSIKLGRFFEQMLGSEHGSFYVADYGSSQFFTAPLELGKRQVQKALDQQPTLVVGVDFLFWYAFGYPRKGNPRRLAGLQMGLKRLESFDCRLIIGDLPNVDHALRGSSPLRAGYPILRKGQLPSDAERQSMNQVIYDWASKRKNVQVFPLSKVMEQMIGGGTMLLRGNEWSVEDLDNVLQPDLLHPRVRASVWVAMYVADASVNLPGVAKESFVWNETTIRENLWDSLEPARAKQIKLQARRALRRAKRDKRKAATK